MRKITDFLGKPIVSLYESATEEIIKDVIFDKNFRKLKYIILFNDGDYQEEKYIKESEIYSYGENAFVIKNNACIDLKENLTEESNNPINNSVYTMSGKFLGIVKDVNLDNKNNIISVEIDNGQVINAELILTSGKDAMFILDEQSKVKLSNFKKRNKISKKNTKTIKVQILKNSNVIKNNTNMRGNLSNGELGSKLNTDNNKEKNNDSEKTNYSQNEILNLQKNYNENIYNQNNYNQNNINENQNLQSISNFNQQNSKQNETKYNNGNYNDYNNSKSDFSNNNVSNNNNSNIGNANFINNSNNENNFAINNESKNIAKLQDNATNITNLGVEPIKPRKKVVLNDSCLPKIKTTKNNFLIGRKVGKNIYSFNNELIVKKNTKITENIIITAKSHSKLKELTLYSN